MFHKLSRIFRALKRGLAASEEPSSIEAAFPEEAEDACVDEGVLAWVRPDEESEEARGEMPRHSSGVLAHPADGGDEVASNKTDAIIGLDFGTSCCKVIVRFPYLTGKPAYPVKFDIEADCSLLLPTEVHYGEVKGELRLEPFEGSEKREDLKVALWKRPEEENSKEFVVGYLALVMKHAMDWILKEKQEELGGFDDFYWRVNVGIPSNGCEDESEWLGFREVAQAAWDLAGTRKKFTVRSARKALKNEFSDDAYQPVDLRPEVIAEVQGYCLSYMKRDGLHLMVDVGASTLDVCGFNLYEPHKGARVSTLLTPIVEELGANALKVRKPTWLKTVRKNVLVDNDEFGHECIRAVEMSLDRLKSKMAPYAPAFKKGEPLRVFLCGGGGQLRFYEKVIEEVSDRVDGRWLDFGGLYCDPVPMPDSVKWPSDIGDEHYCRMAVAFGLSFSNDDVGHIIPSSSVTEIQLPPEIPPQMPVGKSQV